MSPPSGSGDILLTPERLISVYMSSVCLSIRQKRTHLLLQFKPDLVETLLVFLSEPEDVHGVWLKSSD